MPTRRQFVSALGATGIGAMLPLSAVHAQTGGEAAMARIKRTATLRTGMVAGAAPYFAKDIATGQWLGFGADFARELASALGVKLQYVETTWGNAVLDLQSNKIDCMFGLGPTEQRRKMIGFTDPVFHNTFTIVARKGYNPTTWAEINKPDARIAVDVGSNQDQFATRTLPNATVRRYDTSGDATLALQTGRADAQVLVVVLAATVLAKAPGLGHMVIPTPVEGTDVCAGIQQESDPALMNFINQWLAEMHRTGKTRATILANMEKLVGIKATDFPKDASF